MLIKGAKILTLDANDSIHDWLLVEGSKVKQSGDGEPPIEIQAAPFLDYHGKTIVPGFIDTHTHFSSYGIFSIGLDVRDVRDFEDLANRIKAYEKSRNEKGPILAFGISDHALEERRLPRKEELDEILVDTPIIIIKYDGHACVANTVMLQWLDLPPNLRGYLGGQTLAEKSGHLITDAYYAGVSKVTNAIPQSRLVKAIVAGSNRALSVGTTTTHTMEGVGFKNDKDVRGILDASLVVKEKLIVYFQKFDVERVLSFKLPRIGGCFSCAVDGAFGSANAAVNEPYKLVTDKINRGVVYHQQEEMDAFVLAAHKAGLQISTHAIGDRAIEIALTAIERAQKAFPREDARHRIEHCEIPTPEQIDRIAAAGIAIATQPAFLHNPLEPMWYIKELLGEERAERMIPLKSFIKSGVLVAGGSDAPVTPIDPIAGIYSACNNPNPDERLDILDALRLFTTNAAAIAFEENEKGSLEPGKAADFIVLNKNPLDLEPEELESVTIEETYINGKRFEPQSDAILPFIAKMLKRKLFG